MTRRFEGAITTPEDAQDSTRLPKATRPPRPIIIEVAAAILIVGGLVGIIGTLTAAVGLGPAPADPGARPVIVLLALLNVLTVIVGALVRRGMSWIFCINVVAVLLFIELTAVPGGNAIAMLLVVLDGFVFIALARHHAWFEWRPPIEERVR